MSIEWNDFDQFKVSHSNDSMEVVHVVTKQLYGEGRVRCCPRWMEKAWSKMLQ